MTGIREGAEAVFTETAEWRTLEQVVEGFYLTAIQELYHIGKGNVRLPGGAGIRRLDEHRGRLRLDRFDLYDNDQRLLTGAQASEGELTGPCVSEPDPQATNGRVVVNLDESLSGCCRVTLFVSEEAAGAGFLVIRYCSPLGGTAEVEVNGHRPGETDFPPTAKSAIFGDLALPVILKPGDNTVVLRKGSIHAAWSDGTEARWDRNGFRAWNGEIVFGDGYDRMWPDSWSGQKKIYFYSRDGSGRHWTLPEEWRDLKKGLIYSLDPSGRLPGIELPIENGRVAPCLPPRVPCVLVAEGWEQ